MAAGTGRSKTRCSTSLDKRATIYREGAVAHEGAGYPAYPAAGG